MDSQKDMFPADIVELGTWKDRKIRKRRTDGWVCASDICAANDRDWSHYKDTDGAKDHFDRVALFLGIPRDRVVESRPGRPERGGGTWIPEIAVWHLAQWCNADFAFQVTLWLHQDARGPAGEHREAKLASVVGEDIAAAVCGMRAEQKETRKDIAELKEDVNCLKEAENRRANSDLEVLDEETLDHWGQALFDGKLGRCPSCENMIIVDLNQRLIAERCRLHNFRGTGRSDREDNWPVCNKCDLLLDREEFRKSREQQFQNFQDMTVREHRQLQFWSCLPGYAKEGEPCH